MVSYIRSDLDFILAQIKIAEDHALCGKQRHSRHVAVRGARWVDPDSTTSSWGLRTVDGTYNHLLPGQEVGRCRQSVPGAFGSRLPDRYDGSRRSTLTPPLPVS